MTGIAIDFDADFDAGFLDEPVKDCENCAYRLGEKKQQGRWRCKHAFDVLMKRNYCAQWRAGR